MLVVRRAFKNYGQTMLPGSVVEPGNIKRVKTRIKDRYLVEVDEHNIDKWKEYFAEKYHVSIGEPVQKEATEIVPEGAKPEETKPEEPTTVKPVVVTAVVK